jgi:hypothetical protein
MTKQIQVSLNNFSKENINGLFLKSLSGNLEVRDIENFELNEFKEGISA